VKESQVARDHAQLLAEIEAAEEAIRVAERELEKIVGDIEVEPRAEKKEVTDVVRAAFSKVDLAKAKLIDVERAVTATKIAAAKAVIAEAERDLEVAIDEIVLSSSTDKQWKTGVVDDASARVRAARMRLVELRKAVEAE
jgi:hypothetical protein